MSPERMSPPQDERLQVWIDQGECTGCGLCPDLVEQVFTVADNGLAHVIEDGQITGEGLDGIARVPLGLEQDTIEVAGDDCPGECIHFVPPGGW